MVHTVCTFNVNNLYARYRFGEFYPGDQARKSAAEAGWGYLPLNTEGTIQLFNEEQRRLAATALSRGKTVSGRSGVLPDVVCLQEVESLLALRKFNDEYLEGYYDHALLIDGRDLRQIDVAILSRLDIVGVRSHVDDLDPKPEKKDPYLFSRDCLEVDLALNKSGSQQLTLFVNHFKSKYAQSPAERQSGDARRRRQAQRVVEVVNERFAGDAFGKAHFAVVGDLNDEPASPHLKPLFDSGLVNAFERIPKEEDRWTEWYRGGNSVSQLDHVLLSPALDEATKSAGLVIERGGVGFARYLRDQSIGPKQTYFQRVDNDLSPVPLDFQFSRLKGVSPDTYASDHCPVFFEVP